MCTYYVVRKCILFLSLVTVGKVYAQGNKPTTQTQAAYSEVPVTPPGYPAGILINHVRVKEALGPFVNATSFEAANYQSAKVTTQYLDGLGRNLQTVFKQSTFGTSPTDLIAPVFYDAMGRESYRYMSYPAQSSDGSFKMNPFTAYENGGIMQTQYPGEKFFYSLTEFEASPLNRPVRTFAAGNSWVGSGDKGIETQYMFNNSSDAVRIWDIGNDANYENNVPETDAMNGIYPDGRLYKTINIDEAQNKMVEYKDKEGKVILKKVEAADTHADAYNGWLCTYYIYDDLDQLRFVMPPKAVKWLAEHDWSFYLNGSVGLTGSMVISNLCFRYEYDSKKRMIAKAVPGADWVYMVYDKRNRVVYTQDGNMRSFTAGGQWLATLYDAFNRPVMTGMIKHPVSRSDMQAIADAAGTGQSDVPAEWIRRPAIPPVININNTIGGTKHLQATGSIEWIDGMKITDEGDIIMEIIPEPTGTSETENINVNGSTLPLGIEFTVLTITYYDSYSFTASTYNTAKNSELDDVGNNNIVSLPTSSENQVKGMVTGQRVRTLPDPNDLSAGTMLTAVTFYDDRLRPIQTQSTNYAGGADILTNRYDFTGKIITSYLVHNNPLNSDLALQTVSIKTNTLFDHAGRVTEVYKTINDIVADRKLIVKNEYDVLGQLISKYLGHISGGSFIETLNYEYNVRGWLKGINKDYVNGSHNNNWFGMELNYDWGFENNQFNGNIAGTKWKSKGDDAQRAYGFTYDKVNRLLFADFNQYTSGGWDKSAGVDFTSEVTGYDENGNILGLRNMGLKLNSSSLIDNLIYTYQFVSNKLINVIDTKNDPTTKLGDFRTRTFWTENNSKATYIQQYNSDPANITINPNNITDYGYDSNGNLVKDLNKDITTGTSVGGGFVGSGIIYNHLNLPFSINVYNKGLIKYIYDALGNKLQKIVSESNGGSETVSTYLGGFLYETIKNDPLRSNILQHFGQEEGRVRISSEVINGVVTKDFVFDYFIKDHLGNVRAVLTDEQRTDIYPIASCEENAVSFEDGVYTITTGQGTVENTPSSLASGNDNYLNNNAIPIKNPFVNQDATSQKMYKLNGAGGGKIGLGITLKVMSGDLINIFGKSYYEDLNTGDDYNNNIIPLALLNSFINAASGTSVINATHTGVTGTHLDGIPSIHSGVSEVLTNNRLDPQDPKPRAYINYILFDENFNYVAGNFSSVANNTESVKLKDHHDELQNIPVIKNGYIYIYCSNESPVNVFFDNVQVTQKRSVLLEETHYYPFGLVMSGISSKALNNSPVNNYKFNGIEQNTDFDINTYEAFYRNLDPQIGRFLQIDPVTTHAESPYVVMGNNPVLNKDWLGDYYTWGNQSVHDRYDRMRKENGDKIAGYLEELSGLNINSTDEKVQAQIKELTTLIQMHGELNSQWNEMEASDIEFQVTDEMPTEKGAAGTASYSSGRVNIKIGPDNKKSDIMAHEFRHGYSFINGELMKGGMLNDMTDEVVAYNAGFLFLDRSTASLVAKGFYDVEWFKKNHLNTELYKHLTGKEESLTTNTLASTVMKYNPNARISFLLGSNKNNANLTTKEAMDILNGYSRRNPPEFQYQNLLKNR